MAQLWEGRVRIEQASVLGADKKTIVKLVPVSSGGYDASEIGEIAKALVVKEVDGIAGYSVWLQGSLELKTRVAFVPITTIAKAVKEGARLEIQKVSRGSAGRKFPAPCLVVIPKGHVFKSSKHTEKKIFGRA
jgi:hypothetical protein